MQNNGQDKLSKKEAIHMYHDDVHRLLKYLPWFETTLGRDLTRYYSGDESEKGFLSIPTYDPTLLSFVKDAQKTNLIDKNYQYIYARQHIRTKEDEWKAIEQTKITDLSPIIGILSKYVLRGMTRASEWNDGVKNEIYYRSLKKLKELIETWDQPLA